jgi:peptidoglycan L-alanyl-D-glutamate endopeptidase CwlK
VTNAKGGTSYHNFGLAIDFALLLPDGKQVSWDLKRDGDGDKVADWTEVVQEAKALGFEWGGDFVSIKDAPHFQMAFGLTTSQLRAGTKPSEIAMAKASAIIDRLKGEADEDMSRIAELEEQVKELTKVVTGLTNSKDVLKEQSLKQAADIKELSTILLELTNTNPPVWSKEALKAFACTPSVLNGKPVIDTPGSATYTEARLITILYRLGLAAQQREDK